MADLPTTLQLLKCTTVRHKNAGPVRRRRQKALQATVLPGLSCLLSFLSSDLLPCTGERDQPSDHPTVNPIIPQRTSPVKCPLGFFLRRLDNGIHTTTVPVFCQPPFCRNLNRFHESGFRHLCQPRCSSQNGHSRSICRTPALFP